MTIQQPDAAAFLTVLQFADSFFPSGGYAHSQGLEGMVRRGWVRTADDVEALLRHQMTQAVLPSDGVALLHAARAAASDDLDTLLAIDQTLFAMKLPAELRAASCHLGRRAVDEFFALAPSPTLERFRAAVRGGATPGTGPVALGVVAAAQGIPGETALLGYCHSSAVVVLGAAMRLLPFTHTQAQRMLHDLHPEIAGLLPDLAGRPWQDMTAFTPELDLAAIGHASDQLRMFAS